MANLFVTLFSGVVFGLTLAAPPGPMNAVIAEESAVRGWIAGFKTGLGAMSADAIFFIWRHSEWSPSSNDFPPCGP